ncbi:ferric iron reductase, partial [Streptomyces sp. NPDC005047]
MDLDPALAVLRPLGGFFVLHASRPSPPRPLPTLAHAYAPDYGETGPDVHVPVLPGRPGDRLADPLAHRVRRVADALRAPEARVAASVAQQGLAARLWSVALACAALTGRVPDLSPELLRWDPDATAPDDLRLAGVRSARSADTPPLAAGGGAPRPAPPPARGGRHERVAPRRGGGGGGRGGGRRPPPPPAGPPGRPAP